MIDAAIIEQCADPALPPAIVERFIERTGSPDPLAVSVRSGGRVVLVPRPTTSEEAMALIRQHVGRNVVRVGVTQYPASVGLMEVGELRAELVDACENIRMGTALFAKVYRIVTRWYGNPTNEEVLPQVFEEAVIAWQTGYFEGTAVFRAEDPGDVALPARLADPADCLEEFGGLPGETLAEHPARADPNEAGIRVDLSRIGATQP